MTKEQQEVIRARCDKATPGPWEIDTYENDNRVTIGTLESSQRHILNWVYLADAVFIASAREDVPALLDALEEAEAERDRWKARAEALERALEGNCGACTRSCYDYDYLKDGERAECGRWIFDEARFSGGEEKP